MLFCERSHALVNAKSGPFFLSNFVAYGFPFILPQMVAVLPSTERITEMQIDSEQVVWDAMVKMRLKRILGVLSAFQTLVS
jgi:hypothetical protein